MPQREKSRKEWVVVGLCHLLFIGVGCKTKADLRREQELERLKSEVKEVRSDRADYETTSEETRTELQRLSSLIEERSQRSQDQIEGLRRDIGDLRSRIQVVEDRSLRLSTDLQASKSQTEERKQTFDEKKQTFTEGKALFDSQRYEDAIEIFKPLSRSRENPESKKSQFFLAESFFSNKEYAAAALEFAEYRKQYAKDSLVPTAIYRQAHCFRGLGKLKEARLFFQELIENYPRHVLTTKAKQEMKRLK